MARGATQHSRRSRTLSRRCLIQAGVLGGLGLGLPQLEQLRAERSTESTAARPKAKSVIYIFLSGGLSQIDSFDMKPDAPDKYRGTFQPIATKTSGIQICEHLPKLAERSQRWSLCRSLTHPFNEHSQGHMVMLSGRSDLPRGFDLNKPRDENWPSIAAIAAQATPQRSSFPATAVLPERIVHRTGRTIPGQFGALMGPHRDPWFLEISRFNNKSYGAFPEYNFHHQRGPEARASNEFAMPQLTLPTDVDTLRLSRRLKVRQLILDQQEALQNTRSVGSFERSYDLAIKLLSDSTTRAAFDLSKSASKELEAYGNNSFGWSLLIAKRLVESGVNLVQVNLGNNETWDTHVNAFHNLENYLFPPTDRAVSALLDDLAATGLLDETFVVMAGEFGRTPQILSVGKGKKPGRDHWGAVQTALFAGGGVEGGRVIGSSDADGGQPKDDPQTPENLASTIYEALGIPRDAHWNELLGRPHPIYRAAAIPGLI